MRRFKYRQKYSIQTRTLYATHQTRQEDTRAGERTGGIFGKKTTQRVKCVRL